MKMVTGSSVSDDALSTRNRICALVAVSGRGLSSCSERMALRPMGVAALSSPRALAAKFSVIRPRAGWPRGTSGMSFSKSGASQRARASTMPAFSAMRRNPSHSVSVPNNSTITSTESLAMANSASTMAEKICALPPTSHWARAATAAVMKKPSHRVLSIRSPRRLQGSAEVTLAREGTNTRELMERQWYPTGFGPVTHCGVFTTPGGPDPSIYTAPWRAGTTKTT